MSSTTGPASMTDDPYAAVRAAEKRDHAKKWDAAAQRLGIDPRTTDRDDLDRIRVEFRRA